MRRPAKLVDKGKPRVTWGRKATGLGEPSQPGCRNQREVRCAAVRLRRVVPSHRRSRSPPRTDRASRLCRDRLVAPLSPVHTGQALRRLRSAHDSGRRFPSAWIDRRSDDGRNPDGSELGAVRDAPKASPEPAHERRTGHAVAVAVRSFRREFLVAHHEEDGHLGGSHAGLLFCAEAPDVPGTGTSLRCIEI